ncbi:SDR family oxidoreductase [uncultured Methylobacterium sp.]|jgi:3-hydroxybutyrate dehydrogenase|uniref:SDR family oxidoreductase n=1 Tax=uncultured Methylobacterium sp. TaxID=157278 RepID=UPI0026107DAF|nr:SDR family oxidoreductase [uncultured Methylobacterium sp.]
MSRTALVTGSTGGLGLACAEALAAAGHAVVLHGLDDPEAAEPVRAALAARHSVAVAYRRADLADPAAIDALAACIPGGPDILVNNAVVRHFAPAEEFSAADWDRALAVNLSAPFHLARLALPGMRARDFGRIVNVASLYAERGARRRIDYTATKAGLVGLTRTLALETAGTGVTCNAVSPGTVPTPAILARIAALAKERGLSEAEATRLYLSERQPSGRFVQPEDVAALVVFLCGPAARDITGAVIPVDGGWSVA